MLRFVGDGDQKKFTKNPRRFSMQNSQANTKKIFTNIFWRAGTLLKILKASHRPQSLHNVFLAPRGSAGVATLRSSVVLALVQGDSKHERRLCLDVRAFPGLFGSLGVQSSAFN